MARIAALVVLPLTLACSSVGDGTGSVRGRVVVPACALYESSYSMQPDFFSGEWHAGSYGIHIARGGSAGEFGDELVFTIDDTAYIDQHLNERIPVGAPGAAPVHASLRLTRSCGVPAIARAQPNIALSAYTGYVVFEAVYRGDPGAAAAARRTSVSSFSIALRDPRVSRDIVGASGARSTLEGREPVVLGESRAELEGNFEFFFTRGRPAQRFQ
jgi:hypothetical protein